MNNIKTHRQDSVDWAKEFHQCEFCGQDGRYWSQNEGEDYKPLGQVVWHCQTHRTEGRENAMYKMYYES